MDQKELTQKLIDASDKYYNSGITVMSDAEFDRQIEELKAMEAKSGIIYPGSPTQNVGITVTALKKARHEHPALSLDKVKYKERDQLAKWLDMEDAVMMWKCDGSTVVLTYDNGKLTSAVTRGNGEEGSVITHNAKIFKGVPQKIEYTGHLVVRGEAMMRNAEFDRVNAAAGGIYENARNLATATIQMLDASSVDREIIFKAFELVTPEPADEFLDKELISQYMGDRLIWLEKLGFDVVDWERVYPSNILAKVEEWKVKIKDLEYPTDGLVFSYDDLVDGWALGSTGHHPKWAIALKWTDETYITTVRDVEWSVGKTGLITPVVVFDKVKMGLGSNVTRASVHNISILRNLTGATGTEIPIIGSKAEVYMANMIIPQVLSITPTEDTKSTGIPRVCPVCNAYAVIEINPDSNTEVLVCTNHNGCPAQQVGKLMNTFGKSGLFVKGLGESQIEDLMKAGLVTADPISFYFMANSYKYRETLPEGNTFMKRVNEFLSKDGWGQKKWDNLIDAIEASRETTLQRFLYSLNIPLLGNDLSKKLSKYWNDDIEAFLDFIKGFTICRTAETPDDDALIEGTYEWGYRQLASIDGVGDEKAKNIMNWIEETIAYREAYEDFVYFVNELKFPAASTNDSADKSFEGLTFCCTGSVTKFKNRDELFAWIESKGGKTSGSVSSKTSYLVNNDVTSTSGKNAKAKELGIPIISEDQLLAM